MYTFKVYKKEDTKGSNKMNGHKVKTKSGRLYWDVNEHD